MEAAVEDKDYIRDRQQKKSRGDETCAQRQRSIWGGAAGGRGDRFYAKTAFKMYITPNLRIV